MIARINRRETIALLGVAAWPLAARAQQGDRVRRIGVLIAADKTDPVAKPVLSAFTQPLAGLGWTDGRNLRMDVLWGGGVPASVAQMQTSRAPFGCTCNGRSIIREMPAEPRPPGGEIAVLRGQGGPRGADIAVFHHGPARAASGPKAAATDA
jgi:hypothetical protein